MDVRNVIIIGSGPAGLTASIYAARANLKPLCFEGFNAGGLFPGGQLMFTTDVENYPGFVDAVTGPELMQRFRGQAERQGTELITADVEKVDFSERPFKVWAEGKEYRAKTIIIATGARANYLGLENEEKLNCTVFGSEPCPIGRTTKQSWVCSKFGGAVITISIVWRLSIEIQKHINIV